MHLPEKNFVPFQNFLMPPKRTTLALGRLGRRRLISPANCSTFFQETEQFLTNKFTLIIFI